MKGQHIFSQSEILSGTMMGNNSVCLPFSENKRQKTKSQERGSETLSGSPWGKKVVRKQATDRKRVSVMLLEMFSSGKSSSQN